MRWQLAWVVDRATLENDPEIMRRIKMGRERGLIELRRAQYKKATIDNNPALQIWLGKNMLAQSDTPNLDKKTAQNAFEKWLDGSDKEESAE